jgi:hypothetical protein
MTRFFASFIQIAANVSNRATERLECFSFMLGVEKSMSVCRLSDLFGRIPFHDVAYNISSNIPGNREGATTRAERVNDRRSAVG